MTPQALVSQLFPGQGSALGGTGRRPSSQEAARQRPSGAAALHRSVPGRAGMREFVRYVLLPDDAGRLRPPFKAAGILKTAFWAAVAILLGLCLGQLN